MKHFVVEATYSAPIERVREATARHRDWLDSGYEAGLFLCSGPKTNPPVGGYLVARAESIEVLQKMFVEEPFNREGLATFTFTEFNPVKRQGWTEEWFGDAPALAPLKAG
ncbi:MAG: hypothetical protein JO141_14000 [Bradyrhizobium sp.]|nr:hypothetical protein [Methylobacteriaceae bacterium]MBV9458615.1 hypothetical protein [Bradyrhizobium sp.]